MSLAKRLARSVARLYAYAMAPDDHTEEERREIIDQAGEAIDAANAAAWFDEYSQKHDDPPEFGVLEVIVEARRIHETEGAKKANQPTRLQLTTGTDDARIREEDKRHED